jgi:hypothetical protein
MTKSIYELCQEFRKAAKGTVLEQDRISNFLVDNPELKTTTVSFDISDVDLKALRWIAQTRDEKMSQSLHKAIHTLGYLIDLQISGGTIICEQVSGERNTLSLIK